MERVKLEIVGMTCEHCARTITNHLKKDPGVKDVQIDWETGTGEVAFEPAITDLSKILKNSVFESHYSARPAS